MDIKKGFSAAFKKLYPVIAATAAAGGPFTSMAFNAVASVIGKDKIDPNDIEKSVIQASADPAVMAQLQLADKQLDLELKKLDVNSIKDLEELAVTDRAGARTMQIETQSWTPSVLSCTAVAGFLVLLGIISFHEVPKESIQVVNIMIGTLGAMVLQVYNFYLGSSSGSRKKDDRDAALALNAAGIGSGTGTGNGGSSTVTNGKK